MGLLDSLVNVPERLRVWQQAGVRYFYLDPADLPETASDVAPQPGVSDDPASWPPLWAALLAKAPPRPRLVITYLDLGFDLTGRSDPRRSTLWRALIRDLRLSGRGLVAFWPLALPEGETLVQRPDIFRAGLHRLAPGRLAIFGPAAAAALALPGEAFVTAGLLDIPCTILPDPDTLLAGDEEVWAHVLTALAGEAA